MSTSIVAGARRVRSNTRAMWDIAFMFSTVAGVAIIVFREDLLPRRFFYDGEHIRQIAQGFNSGFGDQSYVQVAAIYRWFGLAEHPLLASLLGFGLGASVLLLLRLRDEGAPSWPAILLTPVAMLLMAIYLGFYSKDVFLVPLVAVALVATTKRRVEVFFFILMLVYALNFRSYWLLVAIAYIPIRYAIGRRWKARWVALLIVAALVVFSVVIYFGLGVSPDHYRSVVNNARFNSEDAASAIQPLLPDVGFGAGLVNVLGILPLLVVPVPLLLSGSTYHAGLFLALALLWLFFFVGVARQKRVEASKTGAGTARSRSVALVLALLTVQALFEPDYGSTLRHITPLLPIWVALYWSRALDKGLKEGEMSS